MLGFVTLLLIVLCIEALSSWWLFGRDIGGIRRRSLTGISVNRKAETCTHRRVFPPEPQRQLSKEVLRKQQHFVFCWFVLWEAGFLGSCFFLFFFYVTSVHLSPDVKPLSFMTVKSFFLRRNFLWQEVIRKNINLIVLPYEMYMGLYHNPNFNQFKSSVSVYG